MAEDKKTLTLWDFYDTDRRFEGGLVIDDRPGAGIYDHLKYLDEEGRAFRAISSPGSTSRSSHPPEQLCKLGTTHAQDSTAPP